MALFSSVNWLAQSPLGWLIAPGLAISNVTAPSAAENEAVAQLHTRWLALEAWAAGQGKTFPEAAPSAKAQYQAWVAFRDNWDAGKPDVSVTQSATADLYNAEQTAKDLGYHNTFGEDPVKAPDIADATVLLHAADQIDKAAPNLPTPQNIPWWAYALGVGVAVTAAGIAAIALRATPQAALLRRVAGEEKH